jgi:capsular polysaccharide export protein
MDDIRQTMMKDMALAIMHNPNRLRVLAWGFRRHKLLLYQSDNLAIAIWQRLATGLAIRFGIDVQIVKEGAFCRIAASTLLSVAFDDLQNARLQSLIEAGYTVAQQERAQHLLTLWRVHKLSLHHGLRDCEMLLPAKYVVLVDQGDVQLLQGMLDTALSEYPQAHVLVIPCPDWGKKACHASDGSVPFLSHPLVVVLHDAVHPASVLAHAEAVYCDTSSIGFEALLWGKKVRCFGLPFYAGRGLTDDVLPKPENRQVVPLLDLVYAALVAYPYYLNPETKQICEPEQVMVWLGLQRSMRTRFAKTVYALGFSNYKKPIVRCFVQGSQVVFINTPQQIPKHATVLLWGNKTLPDLTVQRIAEQEWHIIRLEDGFIRSVGLGADLIRPLSWALDSFGIYYDATRPSGLEHILQHHQFDEALLERARHLRERLVAAGLTKYNVGTHVWQRPAKQALKVVLVPGQVETDASLAFGAPGIRANVALLKAVRQANPDAYIIYKPHPDVVAGLRSQGEGEHGAGQWCDEVVIDVSMGQLLGQVDEVHVLTSLTGFEALLRGKQVVCYGLPFYAGWGLTQDVVDLPRRGRQLTLDELVAGALVLYPTYVSRISGCFTTPERALEELLAWRGREPILPWWRRALRVFLQIEAKIKALYS